MALYERLLVDDCDRRAEYRANGSGNFVYHFLKYCDANSAGAKGERAFGLQGNMSLQADERCGSRRGEVDRGIRVLDQQKRRWHDALSS